MNAKSLPQFPFLAALLQHKVRTNGLVTVNRRQIGMDQRLLYFRNRLSAAIDDDQHRLQDAKGEIKVDLRPTAKVHLVGLAQPW